MVKHFNRETIFIRKKNDLSIKKRQIKIEIYTQY